MEVAGGRWNAKTVDGVFKPDYLSARRARPLCTPMYLAMKCMTEFFTYFISLGFFLKRKLSSYIMKFHMEGKGRAEIACLNTWISLHILFVKNKILATFEVPLILSHSLFPQKVFFTFTTTCDSTCLYICSILLHDSCIHRFQLSVPQQCDLYFSCGILIKELATKHESAKKPKLTSRSGIQIEHK